jgi:OOP family OmpA-OmpF porin
VTALAPRARAQSAPPYDPAIDVQLFDFAVGPKTFFTVADADVAAKQQISFDAMVTFLTNPFTIYNVDQNQDMITTTRTKVVSSFLGAQLSGAYGLTDSIQVGAMVPVILSMAGQGLDPNTAQPAMKTMQTSGLGDLRVEVKDRLWQSGQLALGAIGGITLPSRFGTGGSGSDYTGDSYPTVRGAVAVQWRSTDGRISAGGNAGVLLRKPHEIYASTVGQQLTWGVAAGVSITPTFELVGEVFGRTGFDFSLDASPTEAAGGVRVLATKSMVVVAGGGGGLFKGIGSPDLRAFVSIGYAPDTRDSDGDGIANNKDHCPLVAEDKDDYMDDDGCPDDDNDEDGVSDAEDKCPNAKEDHDGYMDEDGCPELDNDGDGIADLEDRCPMDKEDGKGPNVKDGCPNDKRDSDGDGVMDAADQCADKEEDVDGFEDWDGCPDADNDGDGVPDVDDKCPLCPEDKDGVDDGDGCPETDGDHDGVLDAADKCPNEAETINGIDDGDGCGDSGGVQIANLEGDRLTLLRQPSFAGGALDHAGTIIIDQAALVMLTHPEITHWAIAVGAKSQREAEKEAASIKARLVSRGVRADSFDVIAAAGAAQVGFIVRERVDADNPPAFACPVAEAQPKAKPAVESTPAAQPSAPAVPAAKPAPAKPAPAPAAKDGPADSLK